MKRLLLSVCLVGIVFAGNTPNALQTNPMTPAAAVPLNMVRAMFRAPQNLGVQRTALRSSANTDNSEQGTPKGAPMASVEEVFAPALPQISEVPVPPQTSDVKEDDAIWVVVIRGVWMHSGPSVSAAIVSHYSIGKELHVVGSEQGWYQVFDPATEQRGWIYAKYYVEPLDGSGKRVAVREAQPPVKEASERSEPRQPARPVAKQARAMNAQQARGGNDQSLELPPHSRGESVASLLEKAIRR